MLWFRNKLAEQFAHECSELREQLARETAKRIAAETLAEERRLQVERANEYALGALNAQHEAMTGRLTSLDLVNTKLLEAMAPEKSLPDVKNFKPVPRQPNPMQKHRQYADKVIQALYDQRKKAAAPVADSPKESVQ